MLRTHRTDPDKEKGAAIVEMALVAPFLLMVLLGIIEFGWTFSQFQDVRHGAREAARLAAVDAGTDAAMTATVCGQMEVSSGHTVTFDLPAGSEIGDIAEVAVTAPLNLLTNFGLFDAMLPNTLTSEIEFRLEQPATNWSGATTAC
jgi:hypothetical protein